MPSHLKKLTSPPAWLLLLALVFLADLLFAGRVFLARDWLIDFLPARLFEAKTLLAGEFPFWNQYLGGGKPFIADPQSQALYPAGILFVLFDPASAFNLYWLLHLCIAGLGAYFCCRQFDVSKQAAVLAAVTFMLGTWLVSMLEFSINGATGAWIPWILGVLARFHARLPDGPACRPLAELWKQRRLVAALALLLAVQFSANFPEFVLYPMLGYAFYIAAAAFTARNHRHAAALALFLAFGGLLALLLCLPEIAGTRELLPFTERAGSFDPHFDMASMSLRHLLTAIFPFAGGFPGFPLKFWESGLFEYWIGAFYSGALTFVLAPFAFTGWSAKTPREKTPVIAASAMILAGLILAMGDNTPVYPWLHAHTPLLGQFRFPSKFLVLAVMGLLLLTALGAHSLATKRHAPRPLLFALGALVAASLVLALAFAINPALLPALMSASTSPTGAPLPPPAPDALAKAGTLALLSWTFLALAFAWVMLLAKTRIKTAPLLTAGILLAFLNLWIISRQIHPTASADAVFPAAEHVDTTPLARDNQYRAISAYPYLQQFLYADPRPEIYAWAWQAGVGGMWAGSGIRQAHPAMIKLHKHIQFTELAFGSTEILRNQALDLLGVKWIASGSPGDEVLWKNASRRLQIYERPAPMPRFALISIWTPVASDAEAWQRISREKLRLASPLIDPACLYQNRITTHPLVSPDPTISANIPDKLAIARQTENTITLKTDSTGTRLLHFGDTWYPGWRAFIDNREVPIHRVNYTFMGIQIPPGPHTVEFTFYPRHFTFYLLIALATLLLTLSLLLPIKLPRP